MVRKIYVNWMLNDVFIPVTLYNLMLKTLLPMICLNVFEIWKWATYSKDGVFRYMGRAPQMTLREFVHVDGVFHSMVLLYIFRVDIGFRFTSRFSMCSILTKDWFQLSVIRIRGSYEMQLHIQFSSKQLSAYWCNSLWPSDAMCCTTGNHFTEDFPSQSKFHEN